LKEGREDVREKREIVGFDFTTFTTPISTRVF
jgi:hypothetical protein